MENKSERDKGMKEGDKDGWRKIKGGRKEGCVKKKIKE